jgi:DNA repair photolyase
MSFVLTTPAPVTVEPGPGARPEPAGLANRGTPLQPPNRFETLAYEPDPDSEVDPAEERGQPTQFLRDLSVKIITQNDSPDVPFEVSLNPYRGCEHGCIYCFARPTHEYLGFSAGLDFETRILVKERAPELLRAELSAPSWRPRWLALSGVTDPYQPVERRLRLTRRCLEVLAEFRHPVGIITKNQCVTRDIDLLRQLADHQAARVTISLTTLDPALRRIMEPRTSPPTARLAAVQSLADAGIPVGVLLAPIIPAVNDHEIPALLKAARAAGARFAGYTMLRLPHGLKEMFADWLQRHFPERREKVLHQLQASRGGRLNDPRFGSRLRGEGLFAQHIEVLFEKARRRMGFEEERTELSTSSFRRPDGAQLPLFGD